MFFFSIFMSLYCQHLTEASDLAKKIRNMSFSEGVRHYFSLFFEQSNVIMFSGCLFPKSSLSLYISRIQSSLGLNLAKKVFLLQVYRGSQIFWIRFGGGCREGCRLKCRLMFSWWRVCMYVCIHLNICSDTSTSLAAEIGGTDQV